jgi:hypothetical protein
MQNLLIQVIYILLKNYDIYSYINNETHTLGIYLLNIFYLSEPTIELVNYNPPQKSSNCKYKA